MKVIVVLLCVFAQFVYALDTTPLLLIDLNSVVQTTAPDGAPFTATSSDFIRRMLQDATSSKMVLFFIEESLCSEDLSLKDEHGTPFSFLRDHISQKLVKYYERVSQPVELMKAVFPQLTQMRVKEMDATVMRALDKRPKYLYVSFLDGENEPRVAALRRHDAVMKEMYLAARGIVAGPVVAFYTGKMNPITLRRNSHNERKSDGHPHTPHVIYAKPTLEQMQSKSQMVVCPVMLYNISVWVTRIKEIPLAVPEEVILANGTKIMRKTERIEKIRPLSRKWSCHKCRRGSVDPSATEITDDYIYAYVHKYKRTRQSWDCWTLIFTIKRKVTHWLLEYLTVFHRDLHASRRPKVGHNKHFDEPVRWGYSFIYNRPLHFDASDSMKITIARLQIEPIIENIGKEEHERRHYFIERKEYVHRKDVKNESISHLKVEDEQKEQSGENASVPEDLDVVDEGKEQSGENASVYEDYDVEYEDKEPFGESDLKDGAMGTGYPHDNYTLGPHDNYTLGPHDNYTLGPHDNHTLGKPPVPLGKPPVPLGKPPDPVGKAPDLLWEAPKPIEETEESLNPLGDAPKPIVPDPIGKSNPDVEGPEVLITPGILAGLIVSFILFVPLLMSIYMLVSLGNNNSKMRFDQKLLLRPEEVAG